MESSDQCSFQSQSRDQDEFWVTNINRSTHFLTYLAGMATFCPLNFHRIKQSRASEWSDQAIKDNFPRWRFLIPVTNASTGNAYVTTPCTFVNELSPGRNADLTNDCHWWLMISWKWFLKAFTCLLSVTARYGNSVGYVLILPTVWQSWGEQWAGH